MKKLIVFIFICSLLSLLLVFTSCKSSKADAKAATTTTTPTLTQTEKQLQSQIDALSQKVSLIGSDVGKVQSQIKTLVTPTAVPAKPEGPVEIDAMATSIKKLNSAVGSIQEQVTALQKSLQAAETTIGNKDITINGLSVIFITNNIDIGITGSSTPGTAQFAIKIINTNKSAVNNLDFTGTISSWQLYPNSMANGYPQITDVAGLCSFAYNSSSSNSMSFEAYGTGKTSISIPAGGTITIRPKISVMAAPNCQIPAMTVQIGLNTITYDWVK